MGLLEKTHTDSPKLVDFDKSFNKSVLANQFASQFGQCSIHLAPWISACCLHFWHQENMQYEKNVGLLYHWSCIRCYELYICSDLDGIVWVKNAPSELIRAANSPPAPKRTDKNLFETNFVKLAVVDFFSPSHLLLSPFCMKRCVIWGPGRCLIWRDSWLGCEWAVAKPPLHEVLPCGKAWWDLAECCCVCVQGSGGGVVQGQSSRKCPQWRDPWAREGEQSQP